jgi:hypothetical protein
VAHGDLLFGWIRPIPLKLSRYYEPCGATQGNTMPIPRSTSIASEWRVFVCIDNSDSVKHDEVIVIVLDQIIKFDWLRSAKSQGQD